MRKLYIILILAVGALVSSCTKDPMTGGEVPAGMIAIDLSGAAGTPQGVQTRADVQTENEKRITSAHVYFYGADNKLVKTIEANQDGVTISESRVVIPAVLLDITKKYKMVVLANQAAVTGVGDISNFDNLVSTIAAQIKAPTAATNTLAMSGITAEHDFLVNPIAPVTLVRQAVKLNVKVKLNPTFMAAFPGAVFGTVDTGEPTVSVGNVPTASFVLRRGTPVRPTPNSFIDYHNLAMDVAGAVWNVTAYAHENPTTGADDKAKANATYFILRLPYKLTASSEVVTNNYYKVYINNLATPANPHQTIANTVYNVDITVNGFGKEAVTVTTAVQPWNVENLETDVPGGAIKPNKTTVELLDENLNTELIVAYSGMAPLTITPDDPAKFTSITRDAATGIVTIKAKHDNSTAPNPDFATLTISNGDTRLDRTVEVKYTPITVTGLPTTRQDISDIARTKVLSGITISHTAQVKYLSTDKLNATYSGAELTVNTTELNKDGSIIKPMAWSVNITANNGRVVGTVNFRYEPLCWAQGDIALSADNKYIIGGVTSDKTLIFQGGSKYGIVGVETTSWAAPATKSYYAPTVGGAVTSGAAVTFTTFSTISHTSGQGLGDPCTYIGGDKWRSPVQSELKLLLPGTNPDPINGKVASKSGIRGWQLAVYDLFFPWDYATGKSMSQINYDATNVTHLVGYRWSKTSGKTSGGALPAYYAILCDNYNNVANIPRFNWDNERLLIPVRCVRDFTGVEPTE